MPLIRRLAYMAGSSKKIVPFALSSTGAVKISPSGMFIRPSPATYVRPLVVNVRSVPRR